MRLSQKEQQEIKRIIQEIFGDVDIYIFGSQLDSSKRGGDIDIFLQLHANGTNLRIKRAKAKMLLEEKLLRPIDIVIDKNASALITKVALQGVKL